VLRRGWVGGIEAGVVYETPAAYIYVENGSTTAAVDSGSKDGLFL
jgi:hypothetical protein